MIVSSSISTPPLKNIFLLSKSINLFLIPTTGWREQPVPFPPVTDTLLTFSMSKSWGSTIISFTLPVIIGSTNAVVPEEDSTFIIGGLTIS